MAYAAVDRNATEVVVRVYSPSHRPGDKCADSHTLLKLEPGIFCLDFEFKQLGNYIFVIQEDGVVQTILNAKVYA